MIQSISKNKLWFKTKLKNEGVPVVPSTRTLLEVLLSSLGEKSSQTSVYDEVITDEENPTGG
jgi:hypothetical protein